MLKKGIVFLLVLILLFALATSSVLAVPKVMLDDQQLSFDVVPTIENGRTLVPLRAIFEALGADVSWDGATQTVTATKDATQIKLQIGVKTAYKNGSPVTLDVPSKIISDRTLVPLRFVSEALGANVRWDGDTQTIVINNKKVNKKIVCFGDSITQFGNYPNKIADITGFTVYNVGFGGCRMAYHTNPDYDPFSMTKIADAIESGDFTTQDTANININDKNKDSLITLKSIDFTTVDYITIFYGTNDFAGNVPVGTVSDKENTSFCGAINYTADKISKAYPNAKIIFITPIYRSRMVNGDGKDSDNYPNKQGLYLINYVDSIKETVQLKGLSVLDLYRNSGINKQNESIYLKDGLHCTNDGYELIGNNIASFILSKLSN